jgi:curli biogenesis system outer membrane secretion channel CsgG
LNAAKIAKETPSSKNAKNAQTVQENGLKRKVAIARFSNETTYAKGAFYDKENDPLGKQTVDILSAKLAASGKFILLERSDLDAINAEQSIAGLNVQKIGADYLIIGSLTKYGRKNTGETGLVSRTKRQTVEAGVSIRLVDVSTGQIIYSEEANGTAETQTKTTLGMGGQAGFDATLSDKAIDAAISQLVENIVNNCMDRPWKSYFLSVDDDSVIISGGKSQGVKVGDVFDVLTRGKKVKNPQSGMMIELPGKSIGTVTVVMTGGDDPVNEWSLVDLDAKIDKNNLMAYIIQEKE